MMCIYDKCEDGSCEKCQLDKAIEEDIAKREDKLFNEKLTTWSIVTCLIIGYSYILISIILG